MRFHRTKTKTLDMTQGEPAGLILRFAVPLFIGTLFQQAYNLADTMVVGRELGGEAVAAVGATAALYSVLIYFANGLNSGYGIMISRMFGSKNVDGLRKAAAAMVVLDAVITLALTALSLSLLSYLLACLDTPQDIFEQAYTYIFIILAGMPATIGYNMGAGFMRAVGNSWTPLYFLIFSCGLNISLDFLFVIGLGLGVSGAAIATVIAETVSAVLCFVYIYKTYPEFLPRKGDWRLKRELIREMLSTGLAMGLMQSVFSLGTIILQRGINHLGTRIITAHTASQRINEMLMMPLGMIATANATFVGQNFGAGQYERIKKAVRQVLGMELVWSAAAVLAAWTAGPFLIGMLIGAGDMEIIRNGLLNLRFATGFYFPLGILLVLRNALQPMGCKAPPVVSSSIELLIKVVFSFWLIPRLNYLGVAMTEPIIWVVCAGFMGIVYVNFCRRCFLKGK